MQTLEAAEAETLNVDTDPMPWDYKSVHGKCTMTSSDSPFWTDRSPFLGILPIDRNIKDQFIQEFLSSDFHLSKEFVKASQQ